MKFIVIDYVDIPVIITDGAGNPRVFNEYSEATDAVRDDCANGIVVLLKKDTTPLIMDMYTIAKEEMFDDIPDNTTIEELLESGELGGVNERDIDIILRLKDIGE